MTIAEDAKQIYESDLKHHMEPNQLGKFLAIEPNSKAYFLGTTFVEAALAAKRAYPERTSFVLRIGHEAAFHLGASQM
jgi:hypothetical protein